MMAKPFLKVFPTNCVYFMPVIVPGRITTVESIYIGVHGHPNIIGTNYLKDHRLRADARVHFDGGVDRSAGGNR